MKVLKDWRKELRWKVEDYEEYLRDDANWREATIENMQDEYVAQEEDPDDYVPE